MSCFLTASGADCLEFGQDCSLGMRHAAAPTHEMHERMDECYHNLKKASFGTPYLEDMTESSQIREYSRVERSWPALVRGEMPGSSFEAAGCVSVSLEIGWHTRPCRGPARAFGLARRDIWCCRALPFQAYHGEQSPPTHPPTHSQPRPRTTTAAARHSGFSPKNGVHVTEAQYA